MRWRRAAALALLALSGCATGPAAPRAEAYLEALRAGRLDAAYALTSPAYRATVSSEQFRLRFADAEGRQAHATAVEEGLARAAPELFGTASAEAPGAIVLRFSAAVRAGRFEEAWRCLSAPLRTRYSVEALSRDYALEPSARARLDRAARAAEAAGVREGNTVRFPVDGGGAVLVVEEKDGWRLGALE